MKPLQYWTPNGFEISSFQLFYAKYIKPTYALMLNIAKDHLDWHKNMQNYIKSKLKWKCKEGHIWETSLGSVLNGNWCNKCHFYHSEELCRTALEQILNTNFYN